MNLDTILPSVTFTTAELHEIAEYLTKPAVHKYLKHLQANAVKAIANGLPRDGQSDADYLRQQAGVVGTLGAIEALLNISLDPSS